MKNASLSRLTKFSFILSFLLIAVLLLSGAPETSAAITPDRKAVNSKNKSRSKSSKKRYVKRKFRAKSKRKNSTRGFQQPRTENEFEGDAEKREDWFMAKRTYPYAELPADARRRAWLARPADASGVDGRTTAATEWQSIGPKPTNSYFPGNWGLTSGRINAIAVAPSNPQLILIGAATGGVWRSTDGGATFSPTSDNQVDLAVGSIAFAPTDNSIVYAGMGDKAGGYLGTGVLKSTDGGQTWTRVNNSTLPAQGRISAIEVDQNNPNRVYVAQYSRLQGTNQFSSGFWYSNDGGVNWTRNVFGLARDLVRHPTQPNTYYLAMQRVDDGVNATGGVFKSTDAGQTWTRIYSAPFGSLTNIKIAVTPAAPQNVYVAMYGGAPRLEVSTDEGATWTARGTAFDAAQISYNFYLFVHPTDPNTIFVGTRDLWRTTDGGATYTNITGNFTITGGYTPNASKSHPDQHHFYISPTNPNLIYIANDGGLWRSTDGAASFQTLNTTLGLTMFVSLDLHPTDRSKTYGGTQDNGTQRRNAQSVGWKEFATGDGGQVIVDPVDPNIIYTTYVYNTIYRYTNGGSTFNGTIGSSAIFANDRVAFYPPFVTNGVNSNLYFGTYRLHISTNRGATWTQPGGTQDLTNGGGDVLSAIGVSRSNPDVIYTGSATGRVLVSVDGGVNWTNIINGLPNRFIETIIVSPTAPNVAYLTVSGYDSGHVFKTTNAGATWADISGNLPNIPTNTLLIDPRNANTIYVGTDIGVFRSVTDGTNWETFNIGLPPTIVTELDAQPRGLMQVSTYGRGAFEVNLYSQAKTSFDFDGDDKADVSVFRPENGAWYIQQSQNGFTGVAFGQTGDKIVPADYDGDGKTDVAVYRDGTWYLQRSTAGFTGIAFGTASDVPVPADFDGDGKSELAVYRPSSGNWYIYNLVAGQTSGMLFGTNEDKPVPADYDGDGKADVAVFRPSSGSWYLQQSTAGFIGIAFGTAGDKPVPADYDGDGKSDVAVFRPNNGTWYLQRSQLGFAGVAFGASNDTPVPADYDGDGKADVSVFRDGIWYLQRTTQGFTGIGFGTSTDRPAPGAFVF